MTFTPEFAEFWALFPRKVGKLDAAKAYSAVRKRGVSQAELLAGIERYIAHKPGYQDWCHPATWLRQGRWLDEYPVTAQQQPVYVPSGSYEWMKDCQVRHNGECHGSKSKHDDRLRLEAVAS